jgi:hypothetical protein
MMAAISVQQNFNKRYAQRSDSGTVMTLRVIGALLAFV